MKWNYQKAVELKKPWAETMTPIEAAANTNCPTLSPSPLTFPGLPNNSFISLSPLSKIGGFLQDICKKNTRNKKERILGGEGGVFSSLVLFRLILRIFPWNEMKWKERRKPFTMKSWIRVWNTGNGFGFPHIWILACSLSLFLYS